MSAVSAVLGGPLEPDIVRRAARVVIPAVVVCALSVLAFGAIHARLIAPIWSRLVGGIPSAMLAAVSLAWAFDCVSRGEKQPTLIGGAAFGVCMFGTLLPASALDAVMRLNGARLGDTALGMTAAVALFALSGSAVGWVYSRRRSTALVFAFTAAALMIVAGGPLPLIRSSAGAWLSMGVGCICAAAGVSLAAVRSIVLARQHT